MNPTKTARRAAMKTITREIAELGEISASMDAAKARKDYDAFAGDAVAFARKHERIMGLYAAL